MTSAMNSVDMSSMEQNRPDSPELVRSEIGAHGSEEVKHKTDTDQVASPEEKKPSIAPNCTPCLSNGEEICAEVFCENCIEYLCSSCDAFHKKFKATKSHKLNYDFIATQECDPCKFSSIKTYGSCFCTVCGEYLCNACKKAHGQFKATRSHPIISIEESLSYKQNVVFECGVCEDASRQKAVAFCPECEPSEMFCSDCLVHHKAIKTTRNHSVNYDLQQFKRNCSSKESDEKQEGLNCEKPKEENEITPGRPALVGDPKADSVQLRWNSPKVLFPSHQYQIRFKSTAPSDKWKFYDEQYTENTVVLKNMKSDTTFIYQVRMVNNEDEGPYSQRSDLITTKQSAANHLIGFTKVVSSDTSGVITKRKLLLEEIGGGRNSLAKTRKFSLGKPPPLGCTEKTLLLVGATGSGKSTLVDGFINYILGVNWNDPFRFTLVDLEEEEKGLLKNQAVSQTQWITTYVIYPVDGSKLDYKLNIIDTPGFGDTRGFERDQQIVDQIRKLFSASDETGVVCLDAICFLTKAPDARLTPTQRYIFNAILSLFGQDVADNINILVTFADGKTPPVLDALKEAKLPFDVYFPFNNSGLFADNSGTSMSSLSPMFWEMGCRSFCSFFEQLKSMTTKSLKQTKEVLMQRYQLEMTVENLTPLISNGLNKLDELREEQRILKQHKTEIEANKDFTYTVTETKQIKMDLPKGKHVTNCLHCNITCHKDCGIPKDEDKRGCWAMDKEGNCTQCSGKCFWNQHANTPYIFEYVQETKSKTYEEKMEKYRLASDEKMTHEIVEDRMLKELEQLKDVIFGYMNTITKCKNVLKEIALRPNPLNVKEHIDLLIEGEKQEKRPGFQMRIHALMEFRKRCNIEDDVVRFTKDLITTGGRSTVHAKKNKKQGNKEQGKPFFGKMTGYIFGKGQ